MREKISKMTNIENYSTSERNIPQKDREREIKEGPIAPSPINKRPARPPPAPSFSPPVTAPPQYCIQRVSLFLAN